MYVYGVEVLQLRGAVIYKSTADSVPLQQTTPRIRRLPDRP